MVNVEIEKKTDRSERLKKYAEAVKLYNDEKTEGKDEE